MAGSMSIRSACTSATRSSSRLSAHSDRGSPVTRGGRMPTGSFEGCASGVVVTPGDCAVSVIGGSYVGASSTLRDNQSIADSGSPKDVSWAAAGAIASHSAAVRPLVCVQCDRAGDLLGGGCEIGRKEQRPHIGIGHKRNRSEYGQKEYRFNQPPHGLPLSRPARHMWVLPHLLKGVYIPFEARSRYSLINFVARQSHADVRGTYVGS